ncbi:MAG: NAD(P)-dependent oxidoreductase [Alphaproteobacteria bacterium]
MKTISFLGLGVMGGNMARHLAMASSQHGVSDLVVFNRTTSVAKKWLAGLETSNLSIRSSDDIKGAVESADMVFACLGNDASVRAVADEAFSVMKAGAIFIDHTTASASLARALYKDALAKNIHFLDAPISGGEAGAAKGILSIMVGGDKAIFAKAKPLLTCYGKTIEWIGESGSGQLTKMMNQIAIAGLLQALSEAIYFGEQAGIDMQKALQVVSNGGAQSWQIEHRGTTMAAREFDFGFQIKWMVKDLLICLDEAKKLNIQLPITEQVEKFYEELQNSGSEKLDTSALIKRLG